MMAAVPGLPEIAEDALHLALEGHSRHADAHDAGAEGDSSEDHDCSDCSDCSDCVVCHCHASPGIPSELAEFAGAFEAPSSACPHDDETPDEGFSLALERPPKA